MQQPSITPCAATDKVAFSVTLYIHPWICWSLLSSWKSHCKMYRVT